MNSRKNSFKRVAASALAVLTVAAYAAPVANVGGLTSSIIVAEAAGEENIAANAQAGKGVLKIDQAKKYIEGLYEVSVSGGKAKYTKVEFASNDTYVLEKNKSYVIKTTAYMEENEILVNVSKFMSDLEDGVYAYGIKSIEAEKSFDFVTKKTPVKFAGSETGVTVKQNGTAVKAKEGAYNLVQGYPFELTVTPSSANREKMLAITEGTGSVKKQTKEKTSGALTMTGVINENAEDVAVSWVTYRPILELSQANGVVTATDVNFKNLIKDQKVGSINLRYGHYIDEEKTQFYNNSVDENGAFLRDESETTHAASDITANFGTSTVRVNGIDYQYVEWIKATGQKIEKYDAKEKKWEVVEDAKSVGKYRITLDIKAVDKNAILSTSPFKVTKEFEVAYPAVKGVSVSTFDALVFEEDSQEYLSVPTTVSGGTYKVDWNGKEITPALTLKNDKGQVISPEYYFISGATTATDEGTYTITVTFIDKYASFGDLDVTWKIVNTNKYVELKDTNKFSIGYRQATAGSLKSRIVSMLNVVGTDPTEISITYKKETAPGSRKYEKMGSDEKPYDAAGKYAAIVQNAATMKKDGATVNNVIIYFEITPSNITLEPSAAAADYTFGDSVSKGDLFVFVDNYIDENGEPAKDVDIKLPVEKENIGVTIVTADGAPLTYGNYANGSLKAGNYKLTVPADGNKILASDNYSLDGSQDSIPFTVKKRDISDIDFGTVLQPVDTYGKSTRLSKAVIADTANANKKNPAKLDNWIGDDNYDFDFAGGYVTAKNSMLGKTFEVTLRGIGENFTGKTKIKWILGGSAINPKAISYNAEFDVAKPRIMANINLKELEGDIAECGFYYANNDTMTSYANGKTAAQITEKLKNDGKKITFDKSAVTKAKSGNGILQAAIANSSVKKNVYAIAYIKYSNGETVYGELAVNNYYELVLEAEGALEVTKTDIIGDGTNGLTKDKKYVKIHAKRVDKQGYEVLSYGILYNNSSSWVNEEFDKECYNTDKWLSVDYIAEKTVKYGMLNEKELANNMLGVDVYAINSDADKDGFGDKKLYAEAFVKIRDAAGNEKIYYSNLADCTYGAYKVDADTKLYTATLDKNNKTQVEFYNADGEQTKASSGATTLGYNQIDGLED